MGDLMEMLRELQRPQILWEIAAIGLCLGLAALATWLFERRMTRAAPQYQSRTARIGAGSVRRLAFPLLASLLLFSASSLLHALHRSNDLIRFAISLLLALAAIRLVVYALRQAFAPSGWLAAFERAIAVTVWGLFALDAVGILPDVADWMEQVAISIGTQRLSLAQVVHAALTVLASVLAALWIGGVIERRLLHTRNLDASLRLVLGRVSKALLVSMAVLVALPMVGIDLTTLSVFGGALGVGLGFGLQKIASNYVSGFILLLDRSIRPGNIVKLDQYTGEVTEMTTRYTVLRALNGIEAIVPNEVLINSVVQNQTFTNPKVRHSLQVQIAYSSDVERAMRILETAAREHPRVLTDPAPRAFLESFADSGINLELGFWIADPQEGTLGIRSDVNLAVWREFQAAGVEIPFPQREVRLLGPGPGQNITPG